MHAPAQWLGFTPFVSAFLSQSHICMSLGQYCDCETVITFDQQLSGTQARDGQGAAGCHHNPGVRPYYHV
jgi:hypothetical protein